MVMDWRQNLEPEEIFLDLTLDGKFGEQICKVVSL